ncbi:MAG: hypothetical protein KJ072_00350 [Verrucomicrobia bacterium]|nr:hypothetical protein [Verrucomicrobiota bacterium]
MKLNEKYAYDGLWQVSTLDRGTLSGGNITSKVFGQAWTFDQTGNWANFKQDDNGDGTWDLNQNRTHNLANEIATIQVWGAVVHDALGNMTRIPKSSSPANRYACIWDAWNRLVEVKETDGSGNPTTTVAAYAYDGFYRRTKKVIGASTRDYYYSLGWQVLEERVGGTLDRQFVWGIRHIDDLVLRDRGAERLYAVHDAMHLTAVTNASGAVQERYGYESFGKPRFMDAGWNHGVVCEFLPLGVGALCPRSGHWHSDDFATAHEDVCGCLVCRHRRRRDPVLVPLLLYGRLHHGKRVHHVST